MSTTHETDDGKKSSQTEVNTKYSTGNSGQDNSPDQFTENTEQLKEEFLGIEKDVADDVDSGTKYGDLIDSDQIASIEDVRDDEDWEQADFIATPTNHAKIRFLERASQLNNPDAPDTLYQAWEDGVNVGVEHFDIEDFYGYKQARYHPQSDIIMLMNYNDVIETTINKFNESVVLNTDHLIQCKDPDCGRLYNKDNESDCCPHCGYHNRKGRNKTEVELIPRTGS